MAHMNKNTKVMMASVETRPPAAESQHPLANAKPIIEKPIADFTTERGSFPQADDFTLTRNALDKKLYTFEKTLADGRKCSIEVKELPVGNKYRWTVKMPLDTAAKDSYQTITDFATNIDEAIAFMQDKIADAVEKGMKSYVPVPQNKPADAKAPSINDDKKSMTRLRAQHAYAAPRLTH